jgi:hypothetical protein
MNLFCGKDGKGRQCIRLRLKCDGTRAETRFGLSAGVSVQSLLAAEVCASAVVMLDTPCSEVV